MKLLLVVLVAAVIFSAGAALQHRFDRDATLYWHWDVEGR